MPKAYDYDLRRKVLEAIELNGMKRCEASECFGISRNTIHQWLQLKAETGDVKPKPIKNRGHSHKITDWEKFRAFVVANPDKTQTQLAELWQDDLSERTMSRALQRLGFTRKKTYGYRERDEHRRADFRKQLATLEAGQIVYADEAGMDSRDDYAYGYSPQGERLYALNSGSRSGRVNMMAGLCKGQLLAPFTIEGACNRTVFEIWLETCLLPILKPGQKLVIDNATFHKGGGLRSW